MTFHYKSKLYFKSREVYGNDIEESLLHSPCLPYDNPLYYSISSKLNGIEFHKSVPTPVKAAAEFSNPPPTSNEKILIVDDEIDIALFFKLALEQAGFIVDMYNDPLKFLSNYRAGAYDLLLLDIRMPHMNGFELYSKIRQIDDKTMICFMTAFEEYYDEFKRMFSDTHGKECFIRKPIGMNDLVKTVKSHLNYD